MQKRVQNDTGFETVLEFKNNIIFLFCLENGIKATVVNHTCNSIDGCRSHLKLHLLSLSCELSTYQPFNQSTQSPLIKIYFKEMIRGKGSILESSNFNMDQVCKSRKNSSLQNICKMIHEQIILIISLPKPHFKAVSLLAIIYI